MAVGIINNVRNTFNGELLTDPRFYAGMSQSMENLIRQKRDDTEYCEAFLREAEALVKRLAGQLGSSQQPAMLDDHPEAIVLFNNLPSLPASNFRYPESPEALGKFALQLDGWCGRLHQLTGREIK